MCAVDNEYPFRTGETIECDTQIDADAIRKYAELAGDDNPLHYDEQLAKASRFEGLIVGGTHTSASMMAVVASYLSQRSLNVALGYSVRLNRPVRAGERVRIEWTIVSIGSNARLRGDILPLEGRLSTARGKTFNE